MPFSSFSFTSTVVSSKRIFWEKTSACAISIAAPNSIRSLPNSLPQLRRGALAVVLAKLLPA
jgi:hypothetical protein